MDRKPLQNVIFTDGHILRVEQDGSTAMIEFRDYAEDTFGLRFTNVTRWVPSHDVLKHEVMDARFHREGAGWRVVFTDDDGEPLLEVSYAAVEKLLSRSGTVA